MPNSELNIESNQLSIKQTFNAPIARLFACFTQPELLAQWHSPEDTMRITAEVDLKIGGNYRIEMTAPDGQSHTAIGQYHEIEEPNKLVYSWRWEGAEGPDTTVTVFLKERGSQTEVELIHTGFENKDTAQHHSQGWSGIFDRLAIHLG